MHYAEVGNAVLAGIDHFCSISCHLWRPSNKRDAQPQSRWLPEGAIFPLAIVAETVFGRRTCKAGSAVARPSSKGLGQAMAILVTGATGLLGRAIALSFANEGVALHVVGRDKQKLRAIYGDGARAFAWDPAISDFPREALEGVNLAYHLMGEPVGGRWFKAKKRRIVTSRVTSAQKLAQALEGRPCRLVSASSFAMYPGRRGEVYDEKMRAVEASSFIQATIRAWENAALSAASGQSRVSVIRFGMVCGPDAYPKKLVALFKKGAGFIAGDGEQIVPIVDIDDAVAMMRWVAERGIDGVTNCVSPRLPRFREVAESIAQAVEQPIRFTIPDWLARPILGGSADYFLLSYDIRSARALAEGFSFRYGEPRTILARALLPYMRSVGLQPAH
jgi:uncharacterized protein (TIGR01777 family)